MDIQEDKFRKEKWRSIMAQKLGLKRNKELERQSSEMGAINEYSDKMLGKESKQYYL